MDEGGFILYNETFTCAREKPGALCFFFMSGAIPDGWQTYDCHAIPSDCGVDASTQPGYPQ